METKFYSLDEIAQNNGKDGSKIWILIRNGVYDVTDYVEEHPGGAELVMDWAGKECTRAFDDAGHSSDAKKELKKYKIGELREEDRRQKKKDDNAAPEKVQTKRSFCSYLTCGICG